ncbi:MAG: cytochrome P460 family protein [Sandaracinobacteroides sp.]
MDHERVDNVFVDPVSWQAFKKTGKWPEGIMLIKEPRMGARKGSISKGGTFQTEKVFGLEVHVKDSRRFKDGWAFFVHSDGQPAQMIPGDAECYSCHKASGAVDTTFVQFYPAAKPVAVKAGTFEATKQQTGKCQGSRQTRRCQQAIAWQLRQQIGIARCPHGTGQLLRLGCKLTSAQGARLSGLSVEGADEKAGPDPAVQWLRGHGGRLFHRGFWLGIGLRRCSL